MANQPIPPTAFPQCTIRRLLPEDAPGVARLVQSVYGDSYYPPALYDPGQIVQLNEAGKLVSILAVNPDADVVGHYALERFHLVPLAEASDAIVAMDYRHHHILEEMRVVLSDEGSREGLTGLVGYPVTNHLYSQKADEHWGSKPCGVAPGLWPASYHNMPEALPQRMSFIIYFKYLRPAQETVHVRTPHSDMLTRIAKQWDVSMRQVAPAPPDGPGEMMVECEPEVQTGTIRVRRAGADTAAGVRKARRQLLSEGVKAIVLELPLAQPATAELCHDAEADGFFFSGLGPSFAEDGDALLLQYLDDDLDLSLIQVANPFAKELLGYAAERRTPLRA